MAAKGATGTWFARDPDLGVMAAVSQTLDVPTCEDVAEGFGKVVAGEDDDEDYDDDEDDE